MLSHGSGSSIMHPMSCLVALKQFPSGCKHIGPDMYQNQTGREYIDVHTNVYVQLRPMELQNQVRNFTGFYNSIHILQLVVNWDNLLLMWLKPQSVHSGAVPGARLSRARLCHSSFQRFLGGPLTLCGLY